MKQMKQNNIKATPASASPDRRMGIMGPPVPLNSVSSSGKKSPIASDASVMFPALMVTDFTNKCDGVVTF